MWEGIAKELLKKKLKVTSFIPKNKEQKKIIKLTEGH
jgi:hypothetical protein